MAQPGSSFDMSRVSNASKILLGGGVLLFIDSFLAWQKVCVSDVAGDVAELLPGGDQCFTAKMWGGDGSLFGTLAGILVIALLVWEVMGMTGANRSMNLSIPSSKLSAFIGFGVLGFVLLKFLLVIGNQSAFGAYLGLILALAIGYGAWMKFQESSMPAAPGSPTI